MSASTITTRPNAVGLTNLAILGSPSPNTSVRAVSDDTDSTGLQKSAGGSSAVAACTMNPPTGYGTNPVWYSLTPRVRVTGAGTVRLRTYDVRTALQIGVEDVITSAAGTATYTGAARANGISGARVTLADAANIRVDVALDASGTPQIIEVYLDVSLNVAPAVTLTAPVSNVTLRDTLRPLITFTYSDTEADPQERIQVKIATPTGATNALNGVIDPETIPTLYDSGEVFTTALSHKVTADLPAGSYGLLIKAASAGSGGRYGAWTGSGAAFTLTPDLPATPTVRATVDDTNGRVTLTVASYDNEFTYGQSSFETGITLNAASWNATNATLAANTTTFLSGGESLQATYTSTQTPTVRSHTATGTSYAPPAVLAGVLYCGRVSIRANAGSTARPWTAAIEWLNAAGAVISVAVGQAVTDSTATWTESTVFAVAPVGAVQAILRLTSTQPAATEVHLFDQASLAPAPQLLTLNQSSVETDTTGWSADVNAVIARSTAAALYGSASLSVTSSASGDMSAFAGPIPASSAAVQAGHSYTATAAFRSAVSSRSCRVDLRWYNAAVALISTTTGTTSADTTTGFTTVTTTATAPVGAVWGVVVVVILATGAAAEVHYVDGVGLFENANLLDGDSSDFETALGGWVAGTQATIANSTTFAMQGTHSMAVTYAGTGASGYAYTPIGTAGMRVVAGRTYQATVHARSTLASGTARQLRLWIQWFDAAGVALSVSIGSYATPTNTGFVAATVTAAAPAGAVYAGLQTETIGAGGSGSGTAGEVHYVDVASLVATSVIPGWVHGYEAWTRGGMVGNVNLLTANAASMETGVAGWTAGTNATLAEQAAISIDGSSVLAFGTSVNGTNATATSAFVPVTAGTLYTAGAFFASGNSRAASVTILWFKTDGSASSVRASDASPYSAVAIYALYRELIVAAVAPSDAVYASVRLTVFNLQTTDTTHYVDAVFLHGGNSEIFRAGGSATPVSYVTIERSVDGGTTWVAVRAGQAVRTAVAGQQATVYDYDAPRGVTAIYRARMFGGTIPITNGSTNPDLSGSSIPSTLDWAATTTSPNDTAPSAALVALCDLAWLKSATDPTKNLQVRLLKDTANSASTEDQAIFEPQGRPTPIVHGGTIRSEVFEGLQFVFLNDAQWDAFEVLRARQEAVLLQTPFGDAGQDQWWIRLGPTRQVVRYTSDGMALAQVRRVTIAAREVAAPTV